MWAWGESTRLACSCRRQVRGRRPTVIPAILAALADGWLTKRELCQLIGWKAPNQARFRELLDSGRLIRRKRETGHGKRPWEYGLGSKS